MVYRTILAGFILLLGSLVAAMTETTVMIQGSTYEIPAIFTTPEGLESAPAVLLIHGFGSDKQEVGNFYMNLAQQLATEGYASLRFDYPGSGDHGAGFETISMGTYLRDAREVLDWLANQPGIDADRLGVVGFSMGGAIGSMLAGQDARVQALVLWSAAGNLSASQTDLYEQYYDIAKNEGYAEVDLGWRKVQLSPAYFESRFTHFPLYDIRNYSQPLLIVHGEADVVVPLSTTRDYLANAGSYDLSLRVIPGADHIFDVLTDDPSNSQTVIDLTTRWLVSRL